MLTRMISLAVVLLVAAPAWAQSYYTSRLIDPRAVNLEVFAAKGDGVADDTQAIQMAIDRAQETTLQGIVLVRPAGGVSGGAPPPASPNPGSPNAPVARATGAKTDRTWPDPRPPTAPVTAPAGPRAHTPDLRRRG